MKQAKMNNLEKVNAGKFSFLKMALELEEGKFQTATREARERNYEFERKAKNVRNGEMDGTDSEDESDDAVAARAARVRGAAADATGTRTAAAEDEASANIVVVRGACVECARRRDGPMGLYVAGRGASWHACGESFR